jgi:AraC family transcriptional regulator, activator of mtrCDE
LSATDQMSQASDALNRLLNAVSVEVRKCSVCSIPGNTQARFEPIGAVTVCYVVAGKGLLTVGNGVPITITPQSIVIAPAQTLQFWSSDKDAGVETHGRERCAPVNDQMAQLLIAGQSDEALSLVRGEINVTNAGIGDFFEHLRQPIVEQLVDQDAAQQVFEIMIDELARPGTGSRALVDGLMKAFLIFVLRRHLQREAHSSSVFAIMSDPRLARALVDVLERPERLHTLESLAAAAGMSRTAFIDRFREVFDQTPLEFIQAIRLKFAAHLLKTTSLPIKTVAVSVGYSSRSYFSRAFRSVFNLDPSAYRNAGSGDS